MSLGSAISGHTPRGWVSAAIWLALASWVYIIAGWPDAPRDAKPSKELGRPWTPEDRGSTAAKEAEDDERRAD